MSLPLPIRITVTTALASLLLLPGAAVGAQDTAAAGEQRLQVPARYPVDQVPVPAGLLLNHTNVCAEDALQTGSQAGRMINADLPDAWRDQPRANYQLLSLRQPDGEPGGQEVVEAFDEQLGGLQPGHLGTLSGEVWSVGQVGDLLVQVDTRSVVYVIGPPDFAPADLPELAGLDLTPFTRPPEMGELRLYQACYFERHTDDGLEARADYGREGSTLSVDEFVAALTSAHGDQPGFDAEVGDGEQATVTWRDADRTVSVARMSEGRIRQSITWPIEASAGSDAGAEESSGDAPTEPGDDAGDELTADADDDEAAAAAEVVDDPDATDAEAGRDPGTQDVDDLEAVAGTPDAGEHDASAAAADSTDEGGLPLVVLISIIVAVAIGAGVGITKVRQPTKHGPPHGSRAIATSTPPAHDPPGAPTAGPAKSKKRSEPSRHSQPPPSAPGGHPPAPRRHDEPTD